MGHNFGIGQNNGQSLRKLNKSPKIVRNGHNFNFLAYDPSLPVKLREQIRYQKVKSKISHGVTSNYYLNTVKAMDYERLQRSPGLGEIKEEGEFSKLIP